LIGERFRMHLGKLLLGGALTVATIGSFVGAAFMIYNLVTDGSRQLSAADRARRAALLSNDVVSRLRQDQSALESALEAGQRIGNPQRYETPYLERLGQSQERVWEQAQELRQAAGDTSMDHQLRMRHPRGMTPRESPVQAANIP
jgi:hypothetical protein